MKSILFNTEMVRAILEGRKTVTRRVIKFPVGLTGSYQVGEAGNPENPLWLMWACGIKRPPYRPGDILYVRETWAQVAKTIFWYRADCPQELKNILWNPSIHMPREAARIFLRVTNVQVERLQEITEIQILEQEGIQVDFPEPKPSYMSLAYTETRLKPAVRNAFAKLWDSTIKPADRALYGWEANPWCWVIEFERISGEETEHGLQSAD